MTPAQQSEDTRTESTNRPPLRNIVNQANSAHNNNKAGDTQNTIPHNAVKIHIEHQSRAADTTFDGDKEKVHIK